MNDQNRISVSTTADLLAYFPHSLGFQPRESLGFITLHGSRLGASLRVDLPAPGTNPAAFAQTVLHFLLADDAADRAIAIIYTDQPSTHDAKPYTAYVAAIADAMDNVGLSIADGWLVTSKGWVDYFCSHEGCCDLHPLDEIQDSALSARMVYEGSTDSRAAIDPAFIGTDAARGKITEAAARHDVVNILDFTEPSMCAGRAAWHEAIGTTPDEDTACELVAFLSHRGIRDRIMADAIDPTDDEMVYAEIMRGRYDGKPDWSRVDATCQLLEHLLAYTPTEDRAAVFTTLGWLTWHKGRSTIAADYFDKALQVQPGYRLATLMKELLSRGGMPLTALNGRTAYRNSINGQ